MAAELAIMVIDPLTIGLSKVLMPALLLHQVLEILGLLGAFLMYAFLHHF